MSVSDVPQAFSEEVRVLLLYPAIAHGYLFHVTGEWLYIVFSIIGLISPALEFSIYYVHGLDDLYEYERMKIEKIAILTVLLHLPFVASHILAVGGIFWNINNSDYLLVLLFLAGVFLSFVGLWSFYVADIASRIEKLRGTDAAEKIDDVDGGKRIE